ncbi:ABC transporter ATP-binding protein [Achromobacter sp. K91]|jgi:branched-chain amino acid transport system ATP-binding protein|uniref:ABC transporter ATP-binding protein n=1 Tax=Achromobacter aegrifaciens TaxID=1287736 RepID=A0AAD2KJK1_ACHAE|nr:MULTISPECIES: ABC transporter ATP-binding protein [Achromobacter]MBD9430504.1 ABC transporter ATP-binding protein [Achromobacter sp. ACM03]MBD9472037.1 ABC transporter ATP-binding protein [Achromobacter sp. ACM01]MDR7946959.1 ABC transporter ATP-binding protein [Achromobacter aegrifaciens]RIJ03193.1 ABC transporter ATP-binding protein [Achromobacter sp. K91]CAB3813386.1 High-affinity branched-chain amino acid transport ATP-binding protein LivF [Achromobacter aegrifaciens]
MLQCRNLGAAYGDIVALRGIDLDVRAGEAVALIGVNGAGKTTLLRAISGLLPTTGELNFDGSSLDTLPIQRRVKAGIAHVPEGRRIFPGLTVKENLEVGGSVRGGGSSDDFDRVYDLFPRLKERASQLGWSLSGGEQQMLAIGRALMARPRLLLLDEPSLGLAPRLAEEVYARIARINEGGMTVLLVEQNTVLALGVADRGYVIENGSIVLTDTAETLRLHPRVRDAYLGR